MDDCLEAARSCREFKTCLNFLEQECPLCFDKRPMTQVCFNTLQTFCFDLCKLVLNSFTS